MMKRIAEPRMVVSDGGTGFAKALKKAWPKAKHQRCRELHEWVAKGRSPYDNGDYICGAGGYPLDFISALRAEKELQDWFDSLSEAEKRRKDRAAVISMLPKQTRFILIYPPFRY